MMSSICLELCPPQEHGLHLVLLIQDHQVCILPVRDGALPAEDADDDFTSVRGQYDSDPFVEMVIAHNVAKTALAAKALALLPD